MTTHTHPLRDTGLFVRRFLDDYRRNPVNLLVLVLVPVVFVVVAAGPMADAAELLGGTGLSVETATAGWAAGFLAAIAMYFQTRAARAADRRLVLVGLPTMRLVAARLLAGLGWPCWPRRRRCSPSPRAPGSTIPAGSWRGPRCSR